MNIITAVEQQQTELQKIKLQKVVPACFGREFCNRSNMCRACFAFTDCGKFIKDFGFIKKRVKKIIEVDDWKQIKTNFDGKIQNAEN